ncbi:AMP-binding protein [Bradyrhizobium sp. WD16]|uniref:AMP-binding protein n=1 Tax=Bradyrhizobium sp. WD16 TaxID=1521768 RepID=UPI0020A3A040|nr:AMP-binding protein [Bradyrhizobium sp. WD16]UTD29609.1 AMP-dependent synthetase [Bradyrhizobium sp. WD16]
MTTFPEARAFLLENRTDYATAVAGFRWPDEVEFNWALDWFDAALARAPDSRDRLALWIVDVAATGAETKLTFAELSRRSNRLANLLRARGLRRGDRLLLLLGNVAPLWETMLAAMKLGVVVIPATTLLTADELRDRLERGRARAVVAAQDQVAKFDGLGAGGLTRIVVGAGGDEGWEPYEAAAGFADTFSPDGPTGADDPLLLYFTSGTTAKPKLVRHSQRSYPVGALSTMYWIGLQPGDIHLNISSPGWAKHAWSCVFAPWNAGATVFVVNQPRFDARGLLATVERCGVTTLCAPPTVWRLLIQEDLAAWRMALREVCGAGEPLNPEVIDQVKVAWGLTIRDGYGQTETTALAGNSPGQKVKVGSMGRPLPGYSVTVRDADGRPAREGEVCLLLGEARPAGLMQGYLGEDGAARGAEGEVYRTSDVVFVDDEGYLTFVGRSDDVFKSSDYRISPFELESVLIEHEAVAEAAVVPSPDPIRLAVPKAYVMLTSGAVPSRETALSILRHVQARLAPFKRVRRLEIVAELPKTISGKIRRVQLRRLEHEGDRASVLRGVEFHEDDFPELRAARAAGDT